MGVKLDSTRFVAGEGCLRDDIEGYSFCSWKFHAAIGLWGGQNLARKGPDINRYVVSIY